MRTVKTQRDVRVVRNPARASTTRGARKRRRSRDRPVPMTNHPRDVCSSARVRSSRRPASRPRTRANVSSRVSSFSTPSTHRSIQAILALVPPDVCRVARRTRSCPSTHFSHRRSRESSARRRKWRPVSFQSLTCDGFLLKHNPRVSDEDSTDNDESLTREESYVDLESMQECDRRWPASRVDADNDPTRDDIDATDATLVLFPPRRGINDAVDERAAMGTTTTRSRENYSTFDRSTD